MSLNEIKSEIRKELKEMGISNRYVSVTSYVNRLKPHKLDCILISVVDYPAENVEEYLACVETLYMKYKRLYDSSNVVVLYKKN